MNSRFRVAWMSAGALITGHGVEERVLGVDILRYKVAVLLNRKQRNNCRFCL
jgi:hypothetical protein